jgi:hypothetical protein
MIAFQELYTGEFLMWKLLFCLALEKLCSQEQHKEAQYKVLLPNLKRSWRDSERKQLNESRTDNFP